MILTSIVWISLHSFLLCTASRRSDGDETRTYVEGRRGPTENDYVIPITVKKWMVKKRNGYDDYLKKPYRRNSIPNLSSIIPSASSPYISSQDPDSLSGVFAKWNPKINVTWPPTLPFSDASSDIPSYHMSASNYHDDHDHAHYPTIKSIQYVPIPYCHHDHHDHHHKKKEISLVWPLIFLGLLFLPLLLGALLLPLAFIFISSIIQLLTLLQRIAAPTAAPAAGKRKKRSMTSLHPAVMDQIDSIAARLDDSLEKFFKFLNDC
jgi:hypothetical protein